jgi:hypothetical protein
MPGYEATERFVRTPGPWGHLLLLGVVVWLVLVDLARMVRKP